MKPHCASLPYLVPGGSAKPPGNGLSQFGCVGEGPRQANWWSKLSLVKTCSLFSQRQGRHTGSWWLRSCHKRFLRHHVTRCLTRVDRRSQSVERSYCGPLASCDGRKLERCSCHESRRSAQSQAASCRGPDSGSLEG